MLYIKTVKLRVIARYVVTSLFQTLTTHDCFRPLSNTGDTFESYGLFGSGFIRHKTSTSLLRNSEICLRLSWYLSSFADPMHLNVMVCVT